MGCPHCGTSGALPGGTCANCGKQVNPGAVTAATMTPPSPPINRGTEAPGPGDTGETSSDLSAIPTFAAPDAARSGGLQAPLAGQATGPLAPGEAFGPRYRIIRVLGVGGMGVVYQAWDEELGLAVALKVIRPAASADSTAARELEQRFKRELLLARQVTHRNVVRIHDIGEVGGTKYITMTFVDGRDLSTILQETGHLPVPAALRILRQLAAGLQAAHEAGVVHRDLKPANIMVEGDVAMIMDFGIARPARTLGTGSGPIKALARARSALAIGTTLQGVVVGTVPYMAPEQARGQPVDHRADIYALGMIVRDMLAGMRRWKDPTAALAELTLRMEHAPPSLRGTDPTIPQAVDAIVTRCLQPDPGARYQSTAELIADLDALDAEGNPLPKVHPLTKRLIGAAMAVVLALVGGTWWMARTPAPPPQPEPVSVLVADFQNRTGEPVFDGSLEQALSIALEGASFITAYPRGSAQKIAERLEPGSRLNEEMARLISRREGIKVVLAAAIARTGDRYQISVRALEPAQGKPLAEAKESASGQAEVLKAVASLAGEVRSALGDTTPEGARLAEAETFTAGSLEAMRAYARGQDLNKAGKPREALTAFEEALRLDPHFGRAYANMALIYTNLKQEDSAKASYEQALKYIDRMTEREKYRTLGVYYLGFARNYEKAIENYETLVRLYPADNMGHSNLALAHLYVRNVQRAVAVSRKALEIYPRNLLQRTNYATYSMYAGDFDTAIQQARSVLQENASYEFPQLTLALSLIAKGDERGGREAYATLARVSPLGASLASMGEADLELAYGRPRRALQILETGIAADRREKSSGNMALKQVAAAEAYLALGERKRAARAAREAVAASNHESVLFPAARVLIAAGSPDEATAIATRLENMLQSHTRSYARLVTGLIALQRAQYADAIEAFRAGQKLHDSWFAHMLLAIVYTQAGRFGEALGDWELCIKRRGEATDVFFADTSTMRYLPSVYYWLARSQEALGALSGARGNYQEFLNFRAGADPPDPLAADARRRLGALKVS